MAKCVPMRIVHEDGNTSYRPCQPHEATHISFRTPGCFYFRMIPVGENEKPSWKWNKNVNKPTLSPSLLAQAGKDRCHSYIKDGEIQFLMDCSHEFAGQTLPLFDVDEKTHAYRDEDK